MKLTAITAIFTILIGLCNAQNQPDLTQESEYSVSKSGGRDPFLVKITHKTGVFISKAWDLPENKQKELGFDPAALKKAAYDQKLDIFRREYMQYSADYSEIMMAYLQAGKQPPQPRKLSPEEKELYLQGRLMRLYQSKLNRPTCFSVKLTKYFEDEAKMKAAEAQ